MKLYHGTNIKIVDIDLDQCLPHKDFGQGYYLTPIFDHALNMAFRKTRDCGGEPVVNSYIFDENKALHDGLRIKRFEGANEEWARFVIANRDGSKREAIHDFDIVVGPIADDRVAASITLFQRDYISMENLLERIRFRELTIQYMFHTIDSLKYLKKL